MVEWWSTTAAMSAAILEGEPQGEPARMTAISCDMSKSDDDSTESRRTSVAPGRPRRASLAGSGWPTMVVSLVAPCSERANGLLPAGLRQSKHLHFSWQRTPAWKHSQ